MSRRTIGEVLDLLQDEFEGVTISKIRFLETEGLIKPERTASGYRQFRDRDVERLRYILQAQRDRYLPLKVIKEELDRRVADGAGLHVEVAGPPPAPGAGPPPASGVAPAAAARADHEPPLGEAPGAAAPSEPLRAAELAHEAGLELTELRALQDHGLLPPGDTFDDADMAVAQAAAELLDFGLEARHLRMYRQFADREAALYQQVVAPLQHQRDAEPRQVVEALERLRRSGRTVQRHLLARELRTLVP